ncbi:MAG: amino acid ABC transporter permease [Candidatus Melainabacteria bacterium]
MTLFLCTVWPSLGHALLTTLWMTLLSGLLATAVGGVIAWLQLEPARPWTGFARVYLAVIRNTPLLIQLYLWYRGLPAVGVLLPPEVCGVLALGCYTGAYMAEVFRSALASLPREQRDSALSLGLSLPRTYLGILLPQCLPVLVPPLTNVWIAVLKNSSLLMLITVSELFQFVYKGAVDGFQPLPYFLLGLLLYLVLSVGFSFALQALGRWLTPRALRHAEVRRLQTVGWGA